MPSLCCSFELPPPSITNRSCCVSAVLSLSEAALYQKVKFLPHRPGTRFTRPIGTPRPVFPISHLAVIGTYPRPNPIDPHARDQHPERSAARSGSRSQPQRKGTWKQRADGTLREDLLNLQASTLSRSLRVVALLCLPCCLSKPRQLPVRWPTLG